jgi:Peptidase M15
MTIDKDQIISQVIKLIVGFFSKGSVAPMVSVEIPLDKETPEQPEAAPVFKVSKEELLMGRDKTYALEYTQQISENLDRLLVPINKIRDAYGKPMKVNSGWRPPEINAATPGSAPHSKHMEGLAVDIADPDNALMQWTLQNLQLMKDLNIFCEDFRWTPGWCHYQLGGPVSGKRIFIPSVTRPTAPNRWDGQYDSQFNA